MLHEGDVPDSNRALHIGIKLDFVHFEGVDLTAWIFEVTQYFKFYQTPPTHRLLMASYCMEGEAIEWYQDILDTTQFKFLETLVNALLDCNSPMAYNDPLEALTHLKKLLVCGLQGQA